MAQVEYAEFFPPLGQLGGPNQQWPLAAGVDPIDLGAYRGLDVLLVAEPVDPLDSLSLGLFGPLGDMVYPDEGEWGWQGVKITLWPAATIARSTDNDDVPPAVYVHGGLPASPNFTSSLFDGVDPLTRSRPTVGEIEIIDPAGELDWLLDYVWDGARLTLKRGRRDAKFSTWEAVAQLTTSGIVPALDAKRIALRDLGWQLQGPLHDEQYKGTGSIEGDASLVGRLKPWALGYVFNCEPVLLSAADQIFQWSLGASQQLIAFKHGGVSLPINADYATYEALAAATIPSGEVGTCLAQSLVRPNVTLQYGARVDVIGDADVAYGHLGPTTRAGIARRIATARGPNRLDDASDIDMTGFNRMEILHTAPVGWFFDGEISKAAALDLIMMGILGWWRVRPDGLLTIGYVTSPSTGSTLSIEYKEDGMGEPRVVAIAPPRAGTNVGWRMNAAPQGRTELAASVDDTTAEVLGKEARYAASASPAVATLYPTAQTTFIPASGFWNEVDATIEAARQQGILDVPRKRWRWAMKVDPYADLVGSVVTLTGFDRLAAGAALPLLVVGIDAQGADEVIFDWWG
jgi:hypothetical protein